MPLNDRIFLLLSFDLRKPERKTKETPIAQTNLLIKSLLFASVIHATAQLMFIPNRNSFRSICIFFPYSFALFCRVFFSLCNFGLIPFQWTAKMCFGQKHVIEKQTGQMLRSTQINIDTDEVHTNPDFRYDL